MYIRRGTLMAVPFDLERLEATGGAVALIDNVMQSANATSEVFDIGAGQFDVSPSGALLYLAWRHFSQPGTVTRLGGSDDGVGTVAPGTHACVSLAATLARRAACRLLDARRPQHLGARSRARSADEADVRGTERAGHLDAGRQARNLRSHGGRH